MGKKLKGAKVLLLAPRFYGYEIEIVNKLKEQGAEVTFVHNHPSKVYETLIGISRQLKYGTKWLINHFAHRVYKEIKMLKFDRVLVINGMAITHEITSLIRINNLNDNGIMTLYYWDCLAQVFDDVSRWEDFDRILTFDPADYKEHKSRMEFLPLFYCDKYWNNSATYLQYDAMIVGTFSLTRLNFVNSVKVNNPELNIDSYLYVPKWQIRLHKTFRKHYKWVDYKDLKFKKLGFQQVKELYLASRSAIDIPMPGQNGLTIRTIESLAMHRKIITTNQSIKNYDFYSPNDIYVLSPNDYKLPSKDWFEKPFSIDDKIIETYSITNWMEKLIG